MAAWTTKISSHDSSVQYGPTNGRSSSDPSITIGTDSPRKVEERTYAGDTSRRVRPARSAYCQLDRPQDPGHRQGHRVDHDGDRPVALAADQRRGKRDERDGAPTAGG